MTLTRRSFLSGLSASALMLAGGTVRAAPHAPVLRAEPGSADLGLPNGARIEIWGFGATTPGPAILLRQGERLRRRFVNGLPQASTVHWHGVRLDNAMDGVPDLTQAAVDPGADFLYDFTVPDAGTYWYHPHNRTWEQLARGLYGALIVEETSAPTVDRDEVLLIDDWRLGEDGLLHEASFGAIHDWAHGGRIGNWVTVNGQGEYRTTVRKHDRLRLRLINAANARIFPLGVVGLEGWVVAVDGQPLVQPRPIDDVMVLAPAQRIDLIVDAVGNDDGEAFLVAHGRDERIAIGTLAIAGTARAERLPAPAALAPNPVALPTDLATARRASLVMEGGAMGGMRTASLNGEQLDMRALVSRGYVWALNGVANIPKEPLLTARRGETVEVSLVNRTAWPHAMHVHGHHFLEVRDGTPTGPLRDTILLDAEETRTIAFVADNPGKWLFHCHMVEHAASGMSTWIAVD